MMTQDVADVRNEGRQRVLALTAILADLPRLISEQSSFHSSAALDSAAARAGEAASVAARRATRAEAAGSSLMLELEKTLLGELARCLRPLGQALDEAAGEAWPDLARAEQAAVSSLRQAAARDPWMLSPADVTAEGIAAAPLAAGFPENWRQLSPRCYAVMAGSGVPVAVSAWNCGSSRGWAAQVCGVAAGVYDTPETAAAAAAALHARWLGAS